MDDLSPYELLRLKRVEENRKILKELGLLEPDKPRVFVKRCVQKSTKPLKSRGKSSNGVITSFKNEPDQPRRSVRARKSTRFSLQEDDDPDFEPDGYSSLSEPEDEIPTAPPPKRIKVHRPNSFGAIEGIEVGTIWKTRMDCSFDGVHKPTVAGIHGSKEGAYSIALSGGYEDDLDYGDGFTYTGSGGRDLKGTAAKPKNLRTAPQSKDQTLDGVNGSLVASVVSKRPIRVIRGYKLPSEYAPEEGYRYDGLYTAEKFWFATGLSGFQVVKFALKRLKDQAPPPWDNGNTWQLDIQPQHPSMDLLNEGQDAGDEMNRLEQTDVESSSQRQELCMNDIKVNRRKSKRTPKKFVNTFEENKMDLSSAASEENETDSLENRSFERFKRNKIGLNGKTCNNAFHGNGVNLQFSKTPKIRIKSSELEKNCGCKSSSPVRSISPEITVDEAFSKRKVTNIESSESENELQDSVSYNSFQKYETPLQDLPGQTKILNYFKPYNANNCVVANDTNCSATDKIVKVDEIETKETFQKKKLNKEIVVAKSLRGNQRPSFYNGSLNFSTSNFNKCEPSPKSSNKLELIKKSVPKDNLHETKSKNVNNNTSLKSNTASPPTAFKEQKKDSIKSPKKVQKSPMKEAYNKVMKNPGLSTDPVSIRKCYVKLFKLTDSEFEPFPGWDDDYKENFIGFTYNDLEVAKIKRNQFNGFLDVFGRNKRETVKIIETSEESHEGFRGWNEVHSRSMVVNGFLIHKYSKI